VFPFFILRGDKKINISLIAFMIIAVFAFIIMFWAQQNFGTNKKSPGQINEQSLILFTI